MEKTTCKGLRAHLIEQRKNGLKWREIGKSYPGVPLGTLCRLAHDRHYIPKSPILRAHLGLEALPVTVSPCPKCGTLHAFRKRCPSAPARPRRQYDISFKRLRELIASPYSQS